MTLDYRFPETGPPRAQQVAAKLAVEDASDWIAFALRLVIGIPLSFAPSALLTVAITGRRTLWPHPSFFPVFFWTSVVLVPVMFWIERRRTQHFQWLADVGTRQDGGLLLDVLMAGPNLVWGMVDQYRARDESDDELRALAAGIVIELLDANQPMPLGRLISDQRTSQDVSRALKHLEYCGWIGIPRRRDRVWLNDSIRKELADLQ